MPHLHGEYEGKLNPRSALMQKQMIFLWELWTFNFFSQSESFSGK